MNKTQVVVYVAAGVEQAHLLVNQLHERGIPAYIENEPLHIADGGLPFGLSTAPRVLVHEDHAAEARRIALEFESTVREDALHGDDDEIDEDLDQLGVWPVCPSCGRPRHTSCPICETAGTRFQRAYVPAAGAFAEPTSQEPQPLLVICPTCDEPFSPQFAARCEWCGHRFPDGREAPASTSVADNDWNDRVVVVAISLAVFFFVVLSLALFNLPRL